MDELINAIAAVIASKFEYTIYIDEIEEGFERPSFFICRISDLDTLMNRWTYNTDSIIQIDYFSKLDKYENIADKADQTNVIDTLKHTFMCSQGIKFGDKFAHLLKTNVDYTSDKDIFLQLKLDTTYGTRKDYDEAHPIKPMGEINFNITRR